MVTTLKDERLDKWVQQFLWARGAKKALEDAHEEKMKELNSIMEQLKGRLQSFLDTHGLDNAKTKFGTVHNTTRWTASLADPKAFMDFVINTGKFELLDRKANAAAVKDYVGETSQLPPGCNLTSLKSVGVRKPTKAGVITATVTSGDDDDGE